MPMTHSLVQHQDKLGGTNIRLMIFSYHGIHFRTIKSNGILESLIILLPYVSMSLKCMLFEMYVIFNWQNTQMEPTVSQLNWCMSLHDNFDFELGLLNSFYKWLNVRDRVEQ